MAPIFARDDQPQDQTPLEGEQNFFTVLTKIGYNTAGATTMKTTNPNFSPATTLLIKVAFFTLGLGVTIGLYNLLLYVVEHMTTWRCPDYWAGMFLFWVIQFPLAWIIKARRLRHTNPL